MANGLFNTALVTFLGDLISFYFWCLDIQFPELLSLFMPSFTLTQSLPEVQSIICHHLWHQTLYNLNLLNTKLCFYLIPSNISTIFSTLLKLFTFPYFLHISSFPLTHITFNNQSVQPLPFIYTIHFLLPPWFSVLFWQNH